MPLHSSRQATIFETTSASRKRWKMWGIKIQRGIRNVKREPTENSLSLSLSFLRSVLKGSAEANRAQWRELTSAHLFHLQGLSWTTSRCPSSSSSSFVVPLWLVSDSPSSLSTCRSLLVTKSRLLLSKHAKMKRLARNEWRTVHLEMKVRAKDETISEEISSKLS